MTNEEVVRAFLGKKRLGQGLSTDGDVLFSYMTPVARWQDGGTISVTTRWYSRTTSQHTALLGRMAAQQGTDINTH